jgi:uncharacterized protein YciI
MTGPARTAAPLCLIVLTYVKPLEEVDALLPAHVAWLEQGYAQGLFLVAGRRVPRTGGVIVARGEREAVEALAATDPLVKSGIATIKVIAFTATSAAPAIADLLG